MQFPSLTALSFNLLYSSGSDPVDESAAGTWPQRRPLMRRVVEKHAPEIISYQEVEGDQLEDLKADLTDYDCSQGFRNGTDRSPMWAKRGAPPLLGLALWNWLQNRRFISALSGVLGVAPIILAALQKNAKGQALRDGGYCPIFWTKKRWQLKHDGTFWISHVPQQRDSVMPGAWLPRICHWVELENIANGERLQVFNVHLDWWLLARARGGNYLAQEMNRIWNGAPQLLMGDFNAPRQSATWNALLNAATANENLPLCDAWDNADKQIGPRETYHGGDGDETFPGRIDHILIRPAAPIRRVIAETLHDGKLYPSDHFPLIADIGEKPRS